MKKMLLLIISLFVSVSFADEFVTSSTTVGGYGELHYDMEANNGDGKLDFHRFILYVKHVFNDKWSLMSEIEIEHNMVYSTGSGGYLAMEQAHLNYWDDNWGFKGGVLLVPAGITNEYHEPPTFMSVERPEYNKYIIPTTWFDNGFAFYGNMGDFNWNFTMTGDLDGNNVADGFRDARKKGVYSKTTDWTKTVQMSWTGMEGLKVGGSMTMNDAPFYDANGNQTGTVGINLTEINATYSKNNLYTRLEYGSIAYSNNWAAKNNDGDYVQFNESTCDGDAGCVEIESSSGYYLDLGYNIANLVKCDGDLYVWTRTSAYNKDDMGDDTEISLFGVTFKPANNIAIKFEAGSKGDDDIMRMGLGYMF
jgi:hypothetical protein